MRLLKGRYLCEEPRRIKELDNQLTLFQDPNNHREHKQVKVVAVSPEEKKVSVGNILTIHPTAGERYEVEGEKLLFVKKNEVIYFDEDKEELPTG
jgi:hypothetical protein